jgi:hypothetical protein
MIPEPLIFPYQLLVFFLCIFIILKAEPILGRMDKKTSFYIRMSIWIILVGALTQIFALIQGRVPELTATIMFVGVAFFLGSERRNILKSHMGIEHAK